MQELYGFLCDYKAGKVSINQILSFIDMLIENDKIRGYSGWPNASTIFDVCLNRKQNLDYIIGVLYELKNNSKLKIYPNESMFLDLIDRAKKQKDEYKIAIKGLLED